MSPILFYGVPSGCSFGSIVALEWLGVPYRLCRIDMPGVASSEVFRRINPRGETPAYLTEDGEVITESLAILSHLSGRVAPGNGLNPQGRDRDRLMQMLAFLNTSYFNAFSPLWYLLEHDGGKSEAKALAQYGAGLVERAHAQLEQMLGQQAWLLGDRPSLADAYFSGIARWTNYHQVINVHDFPNIARLREQLDTDPAVKFAYAVEREETAKSSGRFEGHINLHDAIGLMANSN